MNKEERQALVAECKASGMTAKAWCELKGIKYTRYCNWATQINKEKQTAQPQEWVHVAMTQGAHNNSGMKLHYGKFTISVEPGFNPSLLADILKVVDTLC